LEVASIVFCGWLGGFADGGGAGQPGKLFTIENVGKLMQGVAPCVTAVISAKPASSACKPEGPGRFSPGY